MLASSTSLTCTVASQLQLRVLSGNVKIRKIESYEGMAPMSDEGWFDTHSYNVDAYSSLIGIPIMSMNDSDFISYATRNQTPYFNFECSLNTTVTAEILLRDKGLPRTVASVRSFGAYIF
jgi:hypothetical protein